MTYEELEDKVRELESALAKANKALTTVQDELVKQRRLYEDNINNLDEDNFAANYRVQQGNKFSKIEQTADGIKTTVAELEEDVSNQISEIAQTSEEISFKVGTYWYAVVHVDVNPADKNNKAELSKYTDGLITYKDENYYYDNILEKWKKTDSDSIMSQFLQTASGFKLNGNVLIDGNVFTNGEFSTAVQNSINVKVSNGRIVYFIEDTPLFKLERTDAGYMQMYIMNGWKLFFDGSFDFSPATVSGLYAVFE